MSFDVYCIEILVLIMIIRIRTIIKFMENNMRKKFLSYIAIFSLIMGLFVMGQTNTIYADNTKLNPDDMESILNDISSVGKAWESMEFQSQEISEIMQLPRKNSNFYKGIEASINELSNASKV